MLSMPLRAREHGMQILFPPPIAQLIRCGVLGPGGALPMVPTVVVLRVGLAGGV